MLFGATSQFRSTIGADTGKVMGSKDGKRVCAAYARNVLKSHMKNQRHRAEFTRPTRASLRPIMNAIKSMSYTKYTEIYYNFNLLEPVNAP